MDYLTYPSFVKHSKSKDFYDAYSHLWYPWVNCSDKSKTPKAVRKVEFMRIIFLPIAIFLFCVLSFADNKGKTLESEKLLTVFLLHGINGGKETFGNLGSLLEAQFNRNGKKRIQVEALGYETGKEGKTAFDFTSEIYTKVIDYYVEKNLSASAPYSFIMHSQGGRVGIRYVFECLKEKKTTLAFKIKDKKAPIDRYCRYLKGNSPMERSPKNFVHFLTLGTPFWGSAKASGVMGSGLLKFFSELLGFGLAELKEMAYGSAASTKFRKLMLNFEEVESDGLKTKKWVNPLPKGIQVHNIAGDISGRVRKFSGFTATVYDLLRGLLQFDLAVGVSSARFDFIYCLENSLGTLFFLLKKHGDREAKLNQSEADPFPINLKYHY